LAWRSSPPSPPHAPAPCAAHTPPAAALTGGFQRALLTCAIFLLAAAIIALRATNTRGEPAAHPDHLPASLDRIPAPELTD